jgi:2,4-dienoyl-CoA reductase-like NADH-dependent reductase (Old Yellow Enzyme family)
MDPLILDAFGAPRMKNVTHSDPFGPCRLGPVELRNRVLKAATFEGMSPDNVVTQTLIDFHRRMAAGGVALTTVSYIAVSPDGMGAPAEIYIHDRAEKGLAQIADVVHGEGARIAAQLGHAGAVGDLPGKRILGPSKSWTLLGSRVHAMSRGEIDAVVEDFARGAAMLAEAGFDSIELHLGHHYLLSSFMSPRWNRRSDEYGGSVENRSRFPRRVLRSVHDAVGGRMAITAKMNMLDGVPGGLEIDESLEFARFFEGEGVLDAIELSGGGSQLNPMLMFRGDAPRKEMAEALPPMQRLGFRLLGRFLFKDYPFEEAYFLPLARRFREALSLPLILLGGVNSVETIRSAIAEGFDYVAMGRALLRDPDLVNKMASGAVTEGNCTHCNKCMVSIFSGTRCVLDDPNPLNIV